MDCFRSFWPRTGYRLACIIGLLIAAAILGLSGCKKADEIREYSVANPPPPTATHRMLAALVPDEGAATDDKETATESEKEPASERGPQAWFFKLVGPIDAVEMAVAKFDQFVASVRTGKEGRPDWTLPEGWTEDTAAQAPRMGRATIRIGEGKSRLELAVSRLPMPDDRRESWVLANVNRWRSQMDLPPIARSELAETTQQIKAGEQTATKIDLQGVFTGGPMAGMFDASKAPTRETAAPLAADAGKTKTGSPTRLPFDVQVPAEWKPGRTSGGVRLAAYNIEENGVLAAEVTVTPLPVHSGDLAANVDRWRGELKLPPSKPDELKNETKSLVIDGEAADYVHLVGPEDASPREATLGVILRRPDRVWFFKLRGKPEIVEREKQRFEEFVKSVKFKQ